MTNSDSPIINILINIKFINKLQCLRNVRCIYKTTERLQDFSDIIGARAIIQIHFKGINSIYVANAFNTNNIEDGSGLLL